MPGILDIKKILAQRTPEQKDTPKHVLINLFPTEKFDKAFELILLSMGLQGEKNIPIMTISLGSKQDIDQDYLYSNIKKISDYISDKKIKFSVIGNWYNLDGQLVEELKKLVNDSMDFDHFFFNLCINYEPKKEIADACRVIVRKLVMEKGDPDSVTPELIKENIYSSSLLPPDIIIEPSLEFSGTFLWDSKGAEIINLNKPVSEMTRQDIERLL